MKLMHGRHGLFHNHHHHHPNNHDHNPSNANSNSNNNKNSPTSMSVNTSNTQTTSSSSPLGNSTTSGSYTDLLKSMNNSDKNNSNKNLFGSSQDLMNYSLQTRNHNLTTQLVQCKKDWETLQKTFRSTTHGLFVYQTTLARIVNHVQDFHNPNDIQSRHLLDDLIQWTSECEHLSSSCNDPPSIKKESSSGGIDDSMSKTSTTSNDGSEEGGNGKASLKNNKNRTPIIDYNDVQPFVDTSTIPTRNQFWTHHQSLQEQNDALQIEISKWKSSMSRIRLCNVKQQIELKCHQETLSKVVNRIQQTKTFSHQKEILKWYQQCIQEAERYCCTTSSSFSSSIEEEEQQQESNNKPSNPKDAYCKRCHSKLSTNTADSDQECIEEELDDKKENQDVETKKEAPPLPLMMVVTAVAGKSIASGTMTESQRSDTPPVICTATSTSMDEQQQRHEEEEPSAVSSKFILKAKDDEDDVHDNDVTLKTEVSIDNVSSSQDDIAAANVEDPPDTLRPTATNLKESSLMQVHPTTTGCVDTTNNNTKTTYVQQQHSGGCGNCCIM